MFKIKYVMWSKFATVKMYFTELCRYYVSLLYHSTYCHLWGHAVAQLVEELRYKPEGRGIDSRLCHWNFSFTLSFRPHHGPGVDSASNINDYQEYFLGVNAAGACGWQPCHLHEPIVLKSGSLNLLEPSGPVEACNGIALPLPYCHSWVI
jgi:hypothetical protein